jgi:DNA-binding IclR family transcriptional regulator
MTGRERAILDMLEEYGPEIRVAELGERTGLPTPLLTEAIEALFDEGHVLTGRAPNSVRLAPAAPTGRFIRAADKREAYI